MAFFTDLVVVMAMMLPVDGLLQPKNFTVSRSIEIAAENSVISPLLADLRNRDDWGPWAEKRS